MAQLGDTTACNACDQGLEGFRVGYIWLGSQWRMLCHLLPSNPSFLMIKQRCMLNLSALKKLGDLAHHLSQSPSHYMHWVSVFARKFTSKTRFTMEHSVSPKNPSRQ
jgi:hypothetical protein